MVDLLSQTPGVQSDAGLLVSRALAHRTLQDFSRALKDFSAAEKLNPEAEAVVNNRASFDCGCAHRDRCRERNSRGPAG